MTSIKNVYDAFSLKGNFESAVQFGDGHINDTYLVSCTDNGIKKQYVFQRINKNVFHDSELLMSNMLSVCDFICAEAAMRGDDENREALSIVRTKDGKSHYTDDEGYAWRVLNYVPNSKSYTVATSPRQIYSAAKAFGKFQRMLEKFPVSDIGETIPDFHNTPKRLEALVNAAERDVLSRLEEVRAEYEFAIARKDFCNVLEDLKTEGKLPVKVTHNDTKLNNVLFDKDTDEAICVVDLDTIMPGLSVNDFGDLVRSSVSTAAEDEPDLSRVDFQMELYELCVKGFVEGADGTLTECEMEYLPHGAIMMTLECGIRFLTDYLSGDVYFKTHRPKQNLDRARTHFKLVWQMEQKLTKMREIVNNYSQKGD